ncbi:recombinase RecT [Campylobacter gracilis]|uniref:Recombinase, phage RecT family n=1 Tax=Campylobacter gracilis RM3268 TaxID=553220 RepID=C8PFI2_9BACT|nr:recombinase RecT [Campylobacter gracilis]AKT91709.1 DNA single-strand annealing protein, RecT family [Campylobacter gracilis]EEV18448.1 recombinase, phage RecT family [Campylobacter gracilis RM3268]UEB46080.1 recombinase RecT [Campylobacter gracilis]SUW77837.1 phage recombination protein Bet [Campylobacter gracilis]
MNQLQIREQDARELVRAKMDVIKTITGGDKAKMSAFAASLTAMASDPALSICSVQSVIGAGLEIVRLGLNPNKTFGQAYVVPFKNKAQLQIGYKGWLSLAYRNGWIFRALAAYKCDEFEINFAGIKDDIEFSPNYDERDETNSLWVFNNLRGVIVYVKDAGGNEFSEFVPFKKLEQLRLKSQNQKDKEALTNIWGEWAEEMYKAKAIKYVATRLPITEQIQEAINAENEAYKEQPKLEPQPQNLNEFLAKAAQKKAEPVEEIIEAAPLEIDVSEEVLPLDALQSELVARGVDEIEAEKRMERLSPDEARAYLSDPNSIDALAEELRNE